MKIRKALDSDATGAAAVEARQPLSAQWGAEGLRKETELESSVFFVAEEEGFIKGFICARAGGGMAEILNIAVDPLSLRRGIAAGLLDAALREFQERGVTKVTLEVNETNAAARALYAGRGFVPAGVRKRFYGDRDALIMGLNL